MANNRKKQAKSKPAGAKRPTAAAGPEAPRKSGRGSVMARDRKRRQRRKRIETFAIAAVVLGAVGLAIGIPAKNIIENRQFAGQLSGDGCTFDSRTDPGGGDHSETATFQLNPPSGGTHFPQAAPAGDYSTGTVPPDGQIVHSHEHGYITLWYKPGNDEVLQELKRIYQTHRRDILLVPRESLTTAVAATAWNKRLLCDRVDAEKIEKFYEEYVNEGPEKIPHP